MANGNWTLFRRSLADHPGLTLGFIWPALILLALLTRKDADAIPLVRVAVVTVLIGALPWIPIIWTSWTSRHQYEDEES